MFNEDKGNKSLKQAKKRRQSYELNWATKLPWAKVAIVNHKLWKHVGRRWAEKDIHVRKMVKVKFGEVYFLKDTSHAHEERTCLLCAKQNVDGIQ